MYKYLNMSVCNGMGYMYFWNSWTCYIVNESGSEPICGIVHTSTYLRYFNPDDNLIRSLTAFPIDSPRTASLLESKWVCVGLKPYNL